MLKAFLMLGLNSVISSVLVACQNASSELGTKRGALIHANYLNGFVLARFMFNENFFERLDLLERPLSMFAGHS